MFPQAGAVPVLIKIAKCCLKSLKNVKNVKKIVKSLRKVAFWPGGTLKNPLKENPFHLLSTQDKRLGLFSIASKLKKFGRPY